MGHKPKIRGGNGMGLSKPQEMMLKALGEGWIAEHVITTKLRNLGYPHHYKIDLANPDLMIAIEVDGRSHCALERKAQDRRKDEFLASQGWSVFRLSNQKAIKLCTTCTSRDTLLISLMGN
jgi:very-short-patch-repair endonuclease